MKPELQRIEAALQAVAQTYESETLPVDWGTAERGGMATHDLDLLPDFATASEFSPFVALTNSALALNLLKDLQTQVQLWTTSLERVLQQIQEVYAEGPLVDGWLESFNTAHPVTTGYRLCGLGQDGQVWSRSCPANQVPDISLAIVRYQHLQTLLSQKHRLECQLGSVTEALVELHSQLAEPSEP